MLRCRRRIRRESLVPAITLSWTRTDSLPRGRDADFQFKNVGPLVGCPPLLWVYFVSAQKETAERTQNFFQQACDSMLSYSLLNSSFGGLFDSDASGTFAAEEVFRRYDLVVACDSIAEQELNARHEEGHRTGRLCALADFLDFCDGSVQIHQLNLLLGLSRGDTLEGTLKDAVAAIRQHPDLHSEHSDVDIPNAILRRAPEAAAAAGLERFLIATFPPHLKDLLHPYLMPKGLELDDS